MEKLNFIKVIVKSALNESEDLNEISITFQEPVELDETDYQEMKSMLKELFETIFPLEDGVFVYPELKRFSL